MPLDQNHQPLYEVKAGLFKGLAHPIRIHVLELLCDQKEHTVGEIQAHTGLEASHLSQHLAVLRRHQVVTSTRRASHVYYRIASPEVVHLLASARRFLLAFLERQGNTYAKAERLPELPQVETTTNGAK